MIINKITKMKKLTTFATSLLMLLIGGTLLVSCGDDNKKEEPRELNKYAHYSLQVGSDLTHFYDVNITYLSLDGVEHTYTLKMDETIWNFDATTLLDVPAFKCKIELVAKDGYSTDYTAADYLDLGYSYKCTAYSPTVGIKVSSNTYTANLNRDNVDNFVKTHQYQLVIDFPQEF